MPELMMRRVTDRNFKAVIRLSDTLTDLQKKCVAANVVSLAQAYLHRRNAWPRAIYWGTKLVGFVMVDRKPEDLPSEDQPAYYLWRLMIAREFQGQGLGKRVLDFLVNKCRQDHRRALYLSCHTEEAMPYQFYIRYGFIDTGTREDNEEILRFPIQP